MLRFERTGLLAAARAETGVEPLKEGERLRPFEAALGERTCPRVVEPLVEGGSAIDDLLELPGVPGLRGVADILQGPEGPWTLGNVYKETMNSLSQYWNTAPACVWKEGRVKVWVLFRSGQHPSGHPSRGSPCMINGVYLKLRQRLIAFHMVDGSCGILKNDSCLSAA